MVTKSLLGVVGAVYLVLTLIRLIRGPYPQPANAMLDVAQVIFWIVMVAVSIHRRNLGQSK